jgi:hypothetical protein
MEVNIMWFNYATAIISMADVVYSITERINMGVLGIIKASRFANLFWSLVLTGSFSTAVTVLLIGCVFQAAKSGS